jgi:hypothetical protein
MWFEISFTYFKGTPFDEANCGDVVVQTSSVMIMRNPNAFRKDSKEENYYLISKPVESDENVCDLVLISFLIESCLIVQLTNWVINLFTKG